MKPAIVTVAGFVVYSWQITKFIKMPRKSVAQSVAHNGILFLCHKNTHKQLFINQ